MKIKNLSEKNQHGYAKKLILVGCSSNGHRVAYTEQPTSCFDFKALKKLSEPKRSECFKKLEQIQSAQAEEKQKQDEKLKEQAAKAAAHRRKQAEKAKETLAVAKVSTQFTNTTKSYKSSWERRGAACPNSKMGLNSKKSRKKGGAKKKQ